MGALWARRTLVSVPRLASPFIVALREMGLTVIHDRRPRSGRISDQETDPEIRPEEITFLTTTALYVLPSQLFALLSIDMNKRL
jgi:hypothetical protein